MQKNNTKKSKWNQAEIELKSNWRVTLKQNAINEVPYKSWCCSGLNQRESVASVWILEFKWNKTILMLYIYYREC